MNASSTPKRRDDDKEFHVEVAIRETYTVVVNAPSAWDAIHKVKRGEYEDDASGQNGDRRITRVGPARRA